MRKWSPEEFTPPAASGGFSLLAPAPGAAAGRGFRAEYGAAAGADPLARLAPAEQAAVRERIGQEVEASLRAREDDRWRRHEEETQAFANGLAAALEAETQSVLAGVARSAADLALVVAERIVRREVAADPAILARALEDLLLRLPAGAPLTVTVHPDDAAWLADQPDLRARLRIATVQPDRRMTRGGALAIADRREWDATVNGQIAALAEAVEASLAGAATPGEGSHDVAGPALA
ncbi:MAG: FliH/SctL family protein [Candidatus Krumholzibacteriia bacterium]